MQGNTLRGFPDYDICCPCCRRAYAERVLLSQGRNYFGLAGFISEAGCRVQPGVGPPGTTRPSWRPILASGVTDRSRTRRQTRKVIYWFQPPEVALTKSELSKADFRLGAAEKKWRRFLGGLVFGGGFRWFYRRARCFSFQLVAQTATDARWRSWSTGRTIHTKPDVRIVATAVSARLRLSA